MWSKLWIFVCLVAAVATEGYPGIDKKQHKNDGQNLLPENQISDKDVEKNTIELNSGERHSEKSFRKVPAPMVDDDLLEFLVRVADNPAEWNKIRRVLSMLGRDETPDTQTTATSTMATATSTMTTAASTTVTVRPVPPTTRRPAPTTMMPLTSTTTARDRGRGVPITAVAAAASSSWPSAEWISKTVENIRAAARAKEIGAGGVDGGATADDPYDYEDDEDDDDDDDAVSNYEIEEIDAPTTVQPSPPPPPPPQPRAAATGHMSRYLFKRIDGRPGDGRVNGTYVAVVESDHRHPPPRGVVYEPVRQKTTKLTK